MKVARELHETVEGCPRDTFSSVDAAPIVTTCRRSWRRWVRAGGWPGANAIVANSIFCVEVREKLTSQCHCLDASPAPTISSCLLHLPKPTEPSQRCAGRRQATVECRPNRRNAEVGEIQGDARAVDQHADPRRTGPAGDARARSGRCRRRAPPVTAMPASASPSSSRPTSDGTTSNASPVASFGDRREDEHVLHRMRLTSAAFTRSGPLRCAPIRGRTSACRSCR